MEINTLKAVIIAPILTYVVVGGYFFVVLIAAKFLLSGIYGSITQAKNHLKILFMSEKSNNVTAVTVRAQNLPTGHQTPKEILKAYGNPVRFGKHRKEQIKAKHEI